MWHPGDWLVIAMVTALIGGLAAAIYSDAAVDRVEIFSAGQPPASYPAWQSRTLHVHGPLGDTIIQIANGAARIVASPCTQKICINRGWLSRAGETAACLPNRVSLSMLGNDPRFDAMNF